MFWNKTIHNPVNVLKKYQESSDNRNQKQVNEQVSIQKIQLQEHLEEETINFNAQGSVETKDGQLLQFDLSLTMKREFYSFNNAMSKNFLNALSTPFLLTNTD